MFSPTSDRRRWIRTASTAACALALVALGPALNSAAPGGGKAKPSFSGTWKLNRDKSDFGPVPVPQRFDRTIRQNGVNLEMDTTMSGPNGEITSSVKHTTDGKESVNAMQGREVRSTLAWEGDALVIRSRVQIESIEIRSVETWTLSPDAKTLTTSSVLNTPQGEIPLVVLDKVENSGK